MIASHLKARGLKLETDSGRLYSINRGQAYDSAIASPRSERTTSLTREAGVSIKTSTPVEMLGWGPRPGA
jgi:hypothetical protein